MASLRVPLVQISTRSSAGVSLFMSQLSKRLRMRSLQAALLLYRSHADADFSGETHCRV